MVQFHLFHVYFVLLIVIVIKEVFLLKLVCSFISWSILLKTIKSVTIIQIILLFLFYLGIKDIYFIWLCIVIILTVKKFIYLPININNVSSFLSYLAIALAIGSLGAFCLDSVLADYNIGYQLNAGNSQHGTSNESGGGGSSGANSDGGGRPPKGNSDLTVYHLQDKTVNKESNSESHLPQSTSLNSITSDTSYTESDLATAAKADKQNFSNVVKTDTTQASKLYNDKVDELAKAKSELLKYKKSGKIEVGLKVVEEDPF